jgi:hypothetical protein
VVRVVVSHGRRLMVWLAIPVAFYLVVVALAYLFQDRLGRAGCSRRGPRRAPEAT